MCIRDRCADELVRVIREYGSDAIASYASAKATNEDNYVFQLSLIHI